MITIYKGRLDVAGKYSLGEISISEESYNKHIQDGMSEKEIQEFYINKYIGKNGRAGLLHLT